MISKNISIFSSGSQTEDELLDEGQIDQENTSTNQNTGEDYGEQENSNSKGSAYLIFVYYLLLLK